MQDDYEDHEEQLGKRFEDLCVDLCIEGPVKEQAWDKYKEVSNNYCIDGDQLQWLVCALYECVRKSTTDNINSLDNTYVSLDRLLSASKMSFVQFFYRIRKWADMIKVNEELKDRIERIESQFSVSSVIFDKYMHAFYSIFQKCDHSQEDSGEEKFKIQYTDEELYHFIWILYIKIKTNFPAICGDIILSFQLLLCTLDWVASNAIISKVKYIFNLSFKGLPSDFYNRNWKAPEKIPSVLKYICEANDMNYIDCKSARDSFFRNYIEKLLDKEVLKGHESRDDNVISSINFEFNSRALLNLYAEYMMASGDFDERIYLNPNASEEIGSVFNTNISKVNGQLSLNSDLTPSAVRYMQEVINCGNIPGSVDTRRPFNRGCPGKYASTGVISRLNGGINFNNYDSRVMNSNYLFTLLCKRQPGPSEDLIDMIQTHCFSSPIEEITNRIEKLTHKFILSYTGKSSEQKMGSLSSHLQHKQFDPSLQRCQTIHKLYYLALENILKSELNKIELRYKVRSRTCSDNEEMKHNSIDISGLLKKNEFHTSLFAICVEVILVASDSSKHFPWVLDAFELEALYFYKIVEIVLRCVDLSRELVKYFNQVTENIVDSFAWRSTSVLWANLARSGKAPSIEEVTPPERIEQSFKGNKKLIVESSRERSLTKSSMMSSRRLPTSSSNVSGNTGSIVNGSGYRQDEDESARAAAHLLSGEEDKQSQQQHESANSATSTVPNVGGGGGGTSSSYGQQHQSSNKLFSVRHDSLAVFFRHMYFLSSLRLRDLCDRLHINRELMSKIWTAFEHIIIEKTHLLKDRCLDQIIICCVYAVTKAASNRMLSFHEIIQMYRMQPQSARHIYREVLIEMTTVPESTDRGLGDQHSQQTTTSIVDCVYDENHKLSVTDNNNLKVLNTTSIREIKGDIVRFYNSIFLPCIHSYVKRFLNGMSMISGSSKSGMNQPHLSPMPTRNSCLTSNNNVNSLSCINEHHMMHSQTGGLGSTTRKITTNRNVFVSPAKSLIVSGTGGGQVNTSGISGSNSLGSTMSPKRVTFTVNTSPSKELRDINNMIATAASKMKGGLSFTGNTCMTNTGSVSASSSMLKRLDGTPCSTGSGSGFYTNTPSISMIDRSGTTSLASVAKRMKFD